MGLAKLSLLCTMPLFVLACESVSANLTEARLEAQNLQQREILEKRIGAILNDDNIALSANAFVNDSQLVISRSGILNQRGEVINGREQTLPGDGNTQAHRFILKTSGTQCYLYHEQSNTTVALEGVNCVSQ